MRPEDSFKCERKKKTRRSYWRQGSKQSEREDFEPTKPHDDGQSDQGVSEPPKPSLPQNEIQEHTIDEEPSKKELTSLLERLGVADAEERPVGELGGNLPVPVHQLPPRPQFGNHGLIDPSHSKKNARLRVYPQSGIRPMLKSREQSSYIPNQDGFPNCAVSQPYIYGNAPSNSMGQGVFLTPPYQPGSFGQPCQHNGMPPHVLSSQSFPPHHQYDAYRQTHPEYSLGGIPAPHQVNGSFRAP